MSFYLNAIATNVTKSSCNLYVYDLNISVFYILIDSQKFQ